MLCCTVYISQRPDPGRSFYLIKVYPPVHPVRRITCFDLPAGGEPHRIDLCYSGGTHYDWLRLTDADLLAVVEHNDAPPHDVELAAAVEAPRKRKRDQVEEENLAVAIVKSMMEY